MKKSRNETRKEEKFVKMKTVKGREEMVKEIVIETGTEIGIENEIETEKELTGIGIGIEKSDAGEMMTKIDTIL